MAVITDVINKALTKIGATAINSPTDVSPSARAASMVFAGVAQAELRKHAWSFAMGRASLPALAAAPAWGYAYAVELPSDCLRLVYVEGVTDYDLSDAILGSGKPAYVIEGSQLLTDNLPPLKVRYVRDLSGDTSNWDACFVDVFACALAMEVAPILTKSLAVVKSVQGLYAAALMAAKRANAIELPQSSPAAGSWGSTRLY